jgi:hypothetical protein
MGIEQLVAQSGSPAPIQLVLSHPHQDRTG